MGEADDRSSGRLLVVDDDENNRDMISRRLARRGFDVIRAVDGFDALRALGLSAVASGDEPEESPCVFDLILLDIEMPGMSGFDVLRRVRQTHAATRLPVVIATARHDREDVVQALGLGANDYVTKPIDFAVALARIEAQLSHKRAVDRIVALEAEVRSRNTELTGANARMRRSLASAARVQRSLLPAAGPFRLDDRGGAEFAWAFRPCDELGGDIFNVFPLAGAGNGQSVGMYLLDVSGHGVPAALLSVTLSRMLSPVPNQPSLVECVLPGGSLGARPPREVVAELNSRFRMADLDGHYFTIFYAVLDCGPNALRIRYVLAGHPPPMAVLEKGADVVRADESADYAVGWFDHAEYEERTLELAPGDRFFLFSDGITETMDAASGLFGEARLADVLTAHRAAPLQQQIDAVVSAVDAFRHAEVLDDVSLLAVAVLPDG